MAWETNQALTGKLQATLERVSPDHQRGHQRGGDRHSGGACSCRHRDEDRHADRRFVASTVSWSRGFASRLVDGHDIGERAAGVDDDPEGATHRPTRSARRRRPDHLHAGSAPLVEIRGGRSAPVRSRCAGDGSTPLASGHRRSEYRERVVGGQTPPPSRSRWSSSAKPLPEAGNGNRTPRQPSARVAPPRLTVVASASCGFARSRRKSPRCAATSTPGAAWAASAVSTRRAKTLSSGNSRVAGWREGRNSSDQLEQQTDRFDLAEGLAAGHQAIVDLEDLLHGDPATARGVLRSLLPGRSRSC